MSDKPSAARVREFTQASDAIIRILDTIPDAHYSDRFAAVGLAAAKTLRSVPPSEIKGFVEKFISTFIDAAAMIKGHR